MSHVLAALLLSAQWEDVPVPSGWTTTLPFTIQRSGNRFRPKSFSLRSRANIAVTTTYYVDKATGNDANSGADWDNALKTIAAAYAKVDVDQILVKAGYYYYNEVIPVPTRSVEVIGVEAGVNYTSDVLNQIGSFTAVDSHYTATVTTQFVSDVVDESNLDAFGAGQRYEQKASEAEVDTAAGSFFQSGSTLYIRTFDDRDPEGDPDLRYYSALAFAPTQDSITYYFENLNIKRAIRVRNSSATGGLKAYFERCNIMASVLAGVDEVIFWDCTLFFAPGDGNNLDVRNSVNGLTIEIDCEIYNLGAGTSDQASTAHNAHEVVRIMGRYHDTAGQCIADVGVGKSWMLGCHVYDPDVASGVGIKRQAGESWLDRLLIRDCGTYGIDIDAGATINHRKLRFENNGADVNNNGTYQTY